MTKIILVTLVHNRRHLVSHCLQSAINQTLKKKKWLHLIIDNASTDGADKIAEAFCRKHSHMRLEVMRENLGQQKAFNYVLGKWIPDNCPEAEIWVNLDSDDELTPDALDEIEKMFDAHSDVGQIYSGFHIINKAGAIKVKNHPKAKLVKDQFTKEGQKTLRKIFIAQNPIGHVRAFRIEALKKIGGFYTRYLYSTDYSAAGRMFLSGYKIVKINKVLYKWRQHDVQVERQFSPQQTTDWKNMQKEFREEFKKRGLI